MNAARLMAENIARFGEYTAFHYEGREIRNTEEFCLAGRIAKVLLQHGVTPGDRVAVIMPNSPETLAVFYGAWMIGAAAVPVAPQLTAREAGFLITDSGSRLAVTTSAQAGLAAESAPEVLVFGPSVSPGAADITTELGSSAPVGSTIERAPGDMALLLYTSGTTAFPKGVIITHQNVVASCQSCMRLNPDMERMTMLQLLPLNHVYGVLMFNLAVGWGFTSVVLACFEPGNVFDAIQRYRVARTSVVPAMLSALMHSPDRTKYDTSSLRLVLSGGGPLPEKVRAQFQSLFRCAVYQGYGLSESMSVGSATADDEPYRPGASGHTMPLVEIQIADLNDGHRLPPGSRGEVCVGGPAVSPGYWNDPEATRKAFHGGWHWTGDVGYQDEDGYLYITERKKDLIIKAGENISPREIEEALQQHPDVMEAAVVGIPDELYGEDICAVIVLKPGAGATEKDILQHAEHKLMKFKLPAKIVFRPGLPRNIVGKVLKRELREELAQPVSASL